VSLLSMIEDRLSLVIGPNVSNTVSGFRYISADGESNVYLRVRRTSSTSVQAQTGSSLF
jgi:hypothetical protein